MSEREIEEASRTASSSNDDDGLKSIVLPNNPPVLPYGMIQKQNSSSSLRWTQVAAYAAREAILGDDPRVMKRSLNDGE